MAEEIKIVASAVGFDQVDKALKSTATGMNDVAATAKKTGDVLSKDLRAGSSQATQSLSNLSRVAQDAPYGFIGISNNLNPLLEGFQRLKVETGSTSGAFKALLSGLSGPAGIGLALGVVTAAVSFAQIGFTAWTGATKKSAEALDEAKKAMNSIYSEVGKEATQVTTLIAVLDSETESRNRKLSALKELKSINPEIFGQLDFENNKVVGLNVAYKLYLENLKNVVAAKIIQGKIEKETTKLLELQGATLTSAEKAVQNIGKSFQNLRIDRLKQFGSEGANAANNLIDLNKQFEQGKQNQITNVTKNIQDLTSELSKVSKGIKLPEFKPDKIKEVKEETKKAKKELETFDQTVIKTLGDLSDQQQIAIAIDTSTINDQIKIVKDEIARGIKEFNLPSNDQRIIVLAAKLNQLEAIKEIEDAKKKIPKKAKEIDMSINIPMVDIEIYKQFSDLTNSLNTFMQDAAYNLGTGFANALATGIAGGDISGAFNGIFAQMAGLVEELGKQMIKIGITALLAKKALSSVLANPYLAIGAGIALAALGSAIKQTVSQKRGFAVGTRNAPGGMALVGERGPELINLPRGSQVIPAAQTSNMMGAMQSIEVFGMLKGKDIYFSNKKYSNTYSTTT
jgi:hypothetical protein